MSISTDFNSEMNLQRVLAERLWGRSKASEEALKLTFGTIIIRMEEITKTTFDNGKKERVWKAVSTERVKKLNEVFISKICDKVLVGFKENALTLMIEEHQKTGGIQHKIYSAQLKNLFRIYHNFIIDDQLSRAREMSNLWTPEIVEAFKNEGIVLSEAQLEKLIK